jgi:hypothetical protein
MVLDYTDKQNPDYFFVPLVFLEIFTAPAAVIRIGEDTFKMPIDWSLIISDAELGDPEIVPITSLNDRGFNAFCLNPLSSYMAEYKPIEIVNIFQEVKWHFPKLKPGHMLGVPLNSGEKPLCAYFAKDTSKLPDVLDIGKLW